MRWCGSLLAQGFRSKFLNSRPPSGGGLCMGLRNRFLLSVSLFRLRFWKPGWQRLTTTAFLSCR